LSLKNKSSYKKSKSASGPADKDKSKVIKYNLLTTDDTNVDEEIQLLRGIFKVLFLTK